MSTLISTFLPRISRHFSILVCACAASTAFATTFYKWTDDKGTVHYGQTAPANVKAEQLNSRGSHTEPTPQAPSTSSNTTNPASTSTAAVPVVVKKDPELCKKARTDEQMMIQIPIVRIDGKVLTLEQKNQQIQNLRDIQKLNC